MLRHIGIKVGKSGTGKAAETLDRADPEMTRIKRSIYPIGD
jgi:hypothetical protein